MCVLSRHSPGLSVSQLSVHPLWVPLHRVPSTHEATFDAYCHAFVARNGSWRDFRALAHLRIKLATPGISQHSSFPGWNEWLGSATSLSHRAPKLPCSLSHPPAPSGPLVSHLTCAMCNGIPFLLVRLDPTGAPTFPPLGTLCSLTTSSTLSPFRVSHFLTRARQIRCSLLLQRTHCCTLQVPRVCAGLAASRTHSSRSPSLVFPFAVVRQPGCSGQARW